MRTFIIFALTIYTLFALKPVFAESLYDKAKIDTSNGFLVVAAHPQAATVGLQILEQGGNAVDAAVATAFVIGVVEPYASGLGGGGCMLIYLKDEKSYHYLDYYMQTSVHADTAFNREQVYTARSICIPGTPHGLITAVEKYGRLSLEQVIEPAIRIARKGIVVNEHFHTILLDKLDVIMGFDQTQDLYFINDFPPMVGDTLFNEPLVGVLEGLSREGHTYFYKDVYAKNAVQDIRAAGGYLSLQDFSNYETQEKEAVRSDYRHLQLISAPPPQSGTTLLEILNLFESRFHDGLQSFDRDANSIHLLVEAIKRADVDRYHYLGDPQQLRIPVSGLLDQNYADQRFSDFVPDSVNYSRKNNIPVGDPWKYENALRKSEAAQKEADAPHTTHISVIDDEGNAVSLTQTLGLYFGSGFSSQGIIYNSSMTNFYSRPSPNYLSSGRRPLSTICPTMVAKQDTILAVIGTPGGGRVFNVMAQIILRLFEFGDNPLQAIWAPRFSMRANHSKLSMEKGFKPEITAQLQKTGYNIQSYPELSDHFGGVQMIIYDRLTGQYIGVSDPRRSGAAMGSN